MDEPVCDDDERPGQVCERGGVALGGRRQLQGMLLNISVYIQSMFSVFKKSFALTLTLYTFTLGGGGGDCFHTYKTPSNTSKQPI